MGIADKTRASTEKMVMGAVMTAFVVLFQLLGTFTAFFGPFSTAVALIPIVIGASLCGVGVGGWLGLVFGVVVLVSGGANLFLAFSVPGTLITVLVKGAACGLAAGAVYRLLERVNRYLACVTAAVVCPVVNTGIFLLGSWIFFLKDASEIAATLGSGDVGMGLFWGMAMGNFLAEVGMNLLLSPVVVRLLDMRKGRRTHTA